MDERPTQRSRLLYSRGYLELRERIQDKYGKLNPGDCWVSESCFLPRDAHQILFDTLKDAAKRGKAKLKWFPSTVVKELKNTPATTVGKGKQITEAIAIQHKPVAGTPPLNTEPLSQTIEDSYKYENYRRFDKTIIRFYPQVKQQGNSPNWYVVDASETGELSLSLMFLIVLG